MSTITRSVIVHAPPDRCRSACRLGRFTGAFVGLCCQDLAGTRKAADFDYFEYCESE
ncbi:MAG: hypothetical protein ACLFR5_06065 [Halobacteriales archaeon]